MDICGAPSILFHGIALSSHPLVTRFRAQRAVRLWEVHMAEISRDDIVAVLGPLDDNVVAQIIATRVNKEGLIAAHKRILEDRERHDPGPPLEPGPVARVIEILE